MGKLLDAIESPKDVKKLKPEQLPDLAQEIRQYILEVVSSNGGHLGAALGVTDLTVAMHYFFNSPKDVFIWDVGHQVHAHKIITGRKEYFKTFRQPGGMSGFSNIDESDHDLFTTGHAGTSISTALGLASGRRITGSKDKVVAVIGDASIVTGMAFEAINHAGHLKDDLIVVLNDNEMSISPTVGAFNRYLNKMISSPTYNHFRDELGELLKKIPKVGKQVASKAKKFEEGLHNLLTPGMLFEELGFRYFGPIDGHKIDTLLDIFSNISKIKGPVLLHVVTQKGKGYKIAESNPQRWHASTPFCVETGQTKPSKSSQSYTQVFGATVCEVAAKNKKVAVITAAMCEGTGLVDYAKKFPERFFDVGIAEEHGVAFAAGLAKEGLKPIVSIYSTFLQRAHDQIIHDVALQRLNVLFCMDRAGLVGEDGPTHHGVFDIAYMRKIPGMTVMAPRDAAELKQMIQLGVQHTQGPIAIRYPRGTVAEEMFSLEKPMPSSVVEIGKAQILRQGKDIVFLAIGSTVYPAYEAAKMLADELGINVTVVNARFVKPLDESLIASVCRGASWVATFEEGALMGGFGSAVLEFFQREGLNCPVRCYGIPDQFIEHGKRDVLLDRIGLSSKAIYNNTLSQLRPSPAKKG